MVELPLGPLRLVIEHRASAGPTLRVKQASGRERLRFDCFLPGAHLHLDPGGPDRIQPIPAVGDSIDWVLAELRGDLAGWLERADLRLELPLDTEAVAQALDGVAEALRNPPLDLDAVPEAALRARTGAKWRVYPDDVIPVWVADMDYPIAEPISRRLRLAVEDSDLGYPPHPVSTGLPELFAERMQRLFGWKVDPRRVELLSDVVQGIYVALQTYTQPGEGVVVQTPVYPPFLHAVRESGRALVENVLVPGPEGYEIDFDALRASL